MRKRLLVVPICLLLSILLSSSDAAHAQPRAIYSYPVQNATGVSARTMIGVRYSEALSRSSLSKSSFSVTGSNSGAHAGNVILASDQRTVIFIPNIFFSTGEFVSVTINPLHCTSGKKTASFTLSFQISKTKHLISAATEAGKHSHDQPEDILPVPTMTIANSANPAPGDIYLTNFSYTQSQYGTYLLKLDNSGNVLFQQSTYPKWAQDFRPQPNGMYTYFDEQAGKYYGLDSAFVKVDSFEVANGLTADDHELRFLPDGGYALLATFVDSVDMSPFAGYDKAEVKYYAIQVFGEDKNLLLEWRTKDYFPVTDSYEPLTSHQIDYVHCNAIEFDSDTSILLSSRNLAEITKININDASIIWRCGGKHNEFTYTNDTIPFSYQHDVRRLANSNITLFDNGNHRSNILHPYSRAVEYTFDENAKTLTNVWQYRHSPDLYSQAMGSVQRLSNGNTFIGWGISDSTVAITEVMHDGSTTLEMLLPSGHYNYRAYKFTKAEVDTMMTKSGVISGAAPQNISLDQSYPNPVSASASIHFTINEHTQVSLILYDILGNEIKTLFNGAVDAGEYTSKFDTGNLPSGTYIYKLTTPAASLSRTMIHTK